MRPVIYIHGYGSTGNTETAKNLRSFLQDECEVISPTYDCSDPFGARDQLVALVSSLRHDKPVIVGTSLGGFFANLVSRLCDVPAVVVNPSIRPGLSLRKYDESKAVLAGYWQLEADESALSTHPDRIVVLGTRDKVVDPHSNGALLEPSREIVWLDMGHRIEPEHYGTISALIRTLQ